MTTDTLTTCPPFHLAIAVDDLQAARQFYHETLGCTLGRSCDHWIDFNFFGHQVVVHLCQSKTDRVAATNTVDDKQVPIPHFGLILEWHDWQHLADRLRQARTPFVIEPYVRFAGEVGEQATMFLLDPAGNALEFKAFQDRSQIFGTATSRPN